MKLRISNDKGEPLRVVLEPWAYEYNIAPGECIDFVAQGEVPADAFFQVDVSNYGNIVYPEWESPLVVACNALGEEID
jgi:hypothetical protein